MQAVSKEEKKNSEKWKTRSDADDWRGERRRGGGGGGEGQRQNRGRDTESVVDKIYNKSAPRHFQSPKASYSFSPVVLLLVGLPGSGKSTFSSKFRNKGWWIISQDTLGSKDKCISEFRRALSRRKNIVIDR